MRKINKYKYLIHVFVSVILIWVFSDIKHSLQYSVFYQLTNVLTQYAGENERMLPNSVDDLVTWCTVSNIGCSKDGLGYLEFTPNVSLTNSTALKEIKYVKYKDVWMKYLADRVNKYLLFYSENNLWRDNEH